MPLNLHLLNELHADWLALRRALWPDGSDDEHLAEMAALVAEPQRYAQWLARDEAGRAVGLVEAALRHDYVLGTERSPVAFLEGLYVLPAARRQGVARRLVDEAARWGAERGCRELASDALLANTDSHRMHAALGFAETERVVAFVRPLAPSPADTLLLRPAQADDAPLLAVLGSQVFIDTYATAGLRPDLADEVLGEHTPAAVAARLAQPAQQVLLAQWQGHVVGYVEWRLGVMPPVPLPAALRGPAAEVVRLYLLRSFQRRGIGRRLLQAAADATRARGAATLWLTAWEGNARARSFYARCGWQDIGVTSHRIGPAAYPNRVLALALAAAPAATPPAH